MKLTYRRMLPTRVRAWLRSLVVECSTAGCRGFHLSHPLLRRLPGIYLDQSWYCSPACLEEALKQRVEAQLGASIIHLEHRPRMPFRLVLLARGKVSEEQLAHARSMQASSDAGEDLGDALVQLGYAAEDQVAAARASEAGCLFFAGHMQQVAPAFSIPPSLMLLHHAAAVHYSPVTNRLLVGFVYRVASPLLQAVAQITGCRAEACIVTATAWRQQQAALALTAFEEIKETGCSQGRIVDLIVKHALASRADAVRVGLSQTAIWARLGGGTRGRDLIIDLLPGSSVALKHADGEDQSVRKERRGLGSQGRQLPPSSQLA